MRRFSARPFRLALVLVALAAGVPGPATGSSKVLEVRVAGTERLDRETVLYHVTLKPGEDFDPDQARADFAKLWATGFFDDLKLETDERQDGIVLVWTVVERPLLARLSFHGNEGISEEDVRKHLKDRGIEFREGAPFSLGDAERARALIEEQFRDKGYRFARIESRIGDASEGGKTLHFEIDEGSKVRIARIEFEGNQAFPDGKLRGALKKTRQAGFWCFLNKKCVFNEASFQADLEALRDYYYDRGYINFAAGEPVLESVGEGKQRRLHIRIPVEEGARFVVGEVHVEGNSTFPEDTLLALNLLERGQPFSRKRMNESRSHMSEIYGIKGYFNVLIQPRFKTHDESQVVDVTYRVTENELYYVHRIAFKGNTTTKDKVIRRQMRLVEGDLFNTARFKRSLFRIYQLGYFKEPQPKIEPSAEDPTRLDVTIDLQEEGRNDVRIGGGVSGVEGFFGTLAFSTRNLFGSGNSLTVDLQAGKRVKQYVLSFYMPYVADRPISAGLDGFNRFVQYTDFERRGTGGQVLLGYQIGDFWFLRGSYRYEDVDQEPRARFDAEGNEIPLDPTLVALYTDQRRVSSIQPVLTFSSVDNPVRPWRGFRQVLSLEYSGGFLGGTTSLRKPRAATTVYLPLARRVNLALNGEWSEVKGFGGRSVPLFERFFLGGETSIRGYPTFRVSPITQDSAGNDVLLGGNKMLQFNAELQFQLASPLSLVLFADAGNAFDDDEGIELAGLKKSFGAEVRFWTPFLQAPLRLIYSYVPDPLVRNGNRDPKTNFTFSIGTTF